MTRTRKAHGRAQRLMTGLAGCALCATNVGCGPQAQTRASGDMLADSSSVRREDPKLHLPKGGRCRPSAYDDPFLASSDGTTSLAGDGVCNRDGGVELAVSPEYPFGIGYDRNAGQAEELPHYVAYLTFDDGPSEWTLDFLAILASRNVLATFFINARNLKGPDGLDATYVDDAGVSHVFRDVLARTIAAGHTIGNHTTDHKDLATLTEKDARVQLDENERLVNAALVRAGEKPRPLALIRPPYGSPWFHGAVDLSDEKLASERPLIGPILAERGFNVLWNVSATDAQEWASGESFTGKQTTLVVDASVSYEAKIKRVTESVLDAEIVQSGRGAVILMHDTHNATRDALPAIIDRLRALGYSFATVEDYVRDRFGRSSLELTPGPELYDPCASDDERSCSTPGAADTPAVCGRMWSAFDAFGGVGALGAPTTELVRSSDDAAVSQGFEHGVIELHPEAVAPCDVVLVPR